MAISDPGDPMPGVGRMAQQRDQTGADRGPVGDQYYRCALRVPGSDLGGHLGDSATDLGAQFRADALRVSAGTPVLEGLRPACLDLLVGQALPIPEGPFSQAFIGTDRYCGAILEFLGGVSGASQVGRDDLHRLDLRQRRRGGGGLCPTGVVQWNIHLSLEAALGVVIGLAVAPEDHTGGHIWSLPSPDSAPWYRSPGNAMAGQSFHSRSRA